MKNYIYYWNHHMIPEKERFKIKEAVDKKDYFSFINLYKKYSIKAIELGQYYEEFQSWIPMTFLPDKISVYDNDNFVEFLSILDKENFEKITFQECECG